MSKKVFLKKLGKALGSLPKDERAKTLSYYDELIEDRIEEGLSEEAAVAAMGDINDIANEIIADARERGVELKKENGGGAVKVLAIILICVSIAAVLVAGGLFLTKAIGLGFSDLNSGSGEWREVKREFRIENGKTILADLKAYDIFWGTSEDDMVHMTYYENEKISFEVSENAEGVSLIQKNKPFRNIIGFYENRQAIVTIPAGFEGNIVSHVTTGETRIDNISSPVSLEAHSTTGDIIIYDLSILGADFKLTTGDMKMGRCAFDGPLSVKGSTGDINIETVESRSLIISGTTLDTKLANIVTGELEVGCTTGNIDFDTVKATSAFLHATTGHVGLKGFEANDIRIETTTGSVSGTLPGSIADYTIESRVSTGKNSLPESFGNGEKKLVVKTTTGDVRIYFADNQ